MKLVVGKQACTNCKMRGFIHTNQERLHDVPENLRCFFCKECDICKGTGVESRRKAKIRDSMMPVLLPTSLPSEMSEIQE